MDQSSKPSSIADSSVPNAGRIYDYLLGGHHNFEVDRQHGEILLQIAPFMPKTFRLIRWFLGEATRRLLDKKFDKFLDFASGLPTTDHIHQVAPVGTKVIYSDVDPVTVEYGREILGNNPNVRYLECDIGKPEVLLESAEVKELFGDDRRVAIGLNGIAYFLTDEKLMHALRTLYDWAAPGSRLFMCDADADAGETSEKLKPIFDLYASIGQPIFIRSSQRLLEMAEPWQVDEPGVMSLDEWLGIGEDVKNKEIDEWGGRGFFGVILKK